tara:strand:+ start:74 stop:607 length:534 start_codon:yes stop_codon:yes gene_type:complete
MSRVGQKSVTVPQGVTIDLEGQDFTARGPKGELTLKLVDDVIAKLEGAEISITPRHETKRSRAMWGLQRMLVSNVVVGVSEGFAVELEIFGVGYRAAVESNVITLQLGYSHPIEYLLPDGIKAECERPTLIRVFGSDRQKVGQVAAEIRALRPPEPYKGKGVRYRNEYVERKEGKKK